MSYCSGSTKQHLHYWVEASVVCRTCGCLAVVCAECGIVISPCRCRALFAGSRVKRGTPQRIRTSRPLLSRKEKNKAKRDRRKRRGKA